METINHIIREPLFGVFTGLLGFYFGQRFNLWRDWRRDFNEVSDDIFIKLYKERYNVSPMYSVSRIEFETFSWRLPFWKRSGFNRSKEAYYAAKEDNLNQDGFSGGVFYQDTTSIIEAIDKLLRYPKRINR